VYFKISFLLVAGLLLAPSALSGHTLSTQEQKVLTKWLSRHPRYRLATDRDCECSSDIQRMRAGSGGAWKPVRDYHPYVATGDFNSDGAEDLAVVVIDRTKKEGNFAIIIFNGPFETEAASPAFFRKGLDLQRRGLFYGPPRPKPYRLLIGVFESDNSSIFLPLGRSYRLDGGRDEE
jgi:hypothetical protein